MKEKKQSKDWYIAATLLLTAMLIIPSLAMIIAGFPIILIMRGRNPVLVNIILATLWIISIYFGTIHGSKYVNKTYIIKNSRHIVKLATIYEIVFTAFPRLIQSFIFRGLGLFSIVFIVNVAYIIAEIAIFYTISKKYVKNTAAVIPTQQEVIKQSNTL